MRLFPPEDNLVVSGCVLEAQEGKAPGDSTVQFAVSLAILVSLSQGHTHPPPPLAESN